MQKKVWILGIIFLATLAVLAWVHKDTIKATLYGDKVYTAQFLFKPTLHDKSIYFKGLRIGTVLGFHIAGEHVLANLIIYPDYTGILRSGGLLVVVNGTLSYQPPVNESVEAQSKTIPILGFLSKEQAQSFVLNQSLTFNFTARFDSFPSPRNKTLFYKGLAVGILQRTYLRSGKVMAEFSVNSSLSSVPANGCVVLDDGHLSLKVLGSTSAGTLAFGAIIPGYEGLTKFLLEKKLRQIRDLFSKDQQGMLSQKKCCSGPATI